MTQKIKLSEIRELVRKALNESEIKEDKNPCWKGYEQIGMKMKNGKEVPNCVPIKEEDCSECEDKKIEEGISNEKDSAKKNKLTKLRGNVLHKKQLNKSESDLAKEYDIRK